MAPCEVCKIEVRPGDQVRFIDDVTVHYFCSQAHLLEWRRVPDETEIPGQTTVDELLAAPEVGEKEAESEVVEEKTDDPLACPDCGFVAKTKGGLAAHIRAKHA